MGKVISPVIVCVVLLLVTAVSSAQPGAEAESLFSPLTAGTFHKMAYELYGIRDSDEKVMLQAMVLLNAARELDSGTEDFYKDMLIIGSQSAGDGDFDLMFEVFRKYVDDKADFEVVKKAVRYLLGTVDSRQEREELLMRLFTLVRRENSILASELITEIAQLQLEKADKETAANYFQQAYYYNKYNGLAFSRYDELLLKEDKAMEPAAYAINLRLAMDVNPLNIDAVFAFAQYCERTGVYDVAAAAYAYAAQLFKYISPGSDIPASIYLPWSLTSFNTPMLQTRCLDIARQIRQSGRFDIRTEALAALAAKSTGNSALAGDLLKNAGRKAEQKLGTGSVAKDITALQLAWFYSFVQPNTERSLAWANRAFSADPNAPGAKAMFGYALAINDQHDLAQTYVMELGNDQIAALTNAIVQLAKKEKQKAVETLKTAITIDPLSLAANRAKILLVSNGSEYIPKTSPQIISDVLKKEFGENIVGKFLPAGDIFSAKLNLTGSEFSYGSDIKASLIVTNKSPNPLFISDSGIFKGNIRVDARIRGDINRSIPSLISRRVTPSYPVQPGEYVSIPLDLKTGELLRLLPAFPQASLEIEFKVYLDPTLDADGNVSNTLDDIPLVWTVIKRPRVELNRQFLMQRLDALSRGQEGQKIRAAKLFTGLLIEQDFMEKTRPLYRYIRVERPILVDAVKRSVVDKNWKVRVQAIKTLAMWPDRLDYQVTSVVSSSLNDTNWPVRMMALYILSKSQGEEFQLVLDWSAKYDSQQLVRDMSITLGGRGIAVPTVK